MAYDAKRARTVLFGGSSGSTELRDTWEWNGETWIQCFPATIPPGCSHHGIVYDVARSNVVMFASGFYATVPPDLWSWNGIDWTRIVTPNGPSARWGAALCYDIVRSVVVLQGGNGLDTDTWEWNGSTWRQIPASSSSPGFRYDHRLCYDVQRRRSVLFGGSMGVNGSRADTWEWDGSTWSQVSTPSAPSWRSAYGAAYDNARNVTVLYGGYNYLPVPESHFDTWTFDGLQWTLREPDYVALAGEGYALGFDHSRGQALRFGGTGLGTYRDTLVWNGERWVLLSPLSSPPQRSYCSMATDSGRKRLVIFGGDSSGTLLADTWEWDGTNWLLRTASPGPQPSRGHTLAYDPLRARTVLFTCGSGAAPPETWEWDGSAWSQIVVAVSPSTRRDSAMAWDVVRGELLLFGGTASSGAFQDTWSWNGTRWLRLTPSNAPLPRYQHGMASDPVSGNVILYAGLASSSQRYDDTWAWDGVTWFRLSLAHTPIPPRCCAITFDPIGAQFLRPGSTAYDSWFLGLAIPAGVSTFGTGCGSSGNTPRLTSALPYLGAKAFTLDMVEALPNSPVIFGFATAQGNQPLGLGCSLWLGGPILGLPSTSNGFGFSEAQLPVPLERSLRGATLFAQGFVLPPAATAGRSLVLGD